jgi:hypothetical protein
MKETEIIKKLVNTKLPEIELPSHRHQLKIELLNSGQYSKRRVIANQSQARNRLKEGIDTMLKGLFSLQPVWRTVLVTVSVILILGIALTVPLLTGQSSEALAASITRDNPEVVAALNGEEVEITKVIEIVDDKGTVLLLGSTNYVNATVDLKTKQVTEVVRMHIPEFTSADEQEAINIAKSDPGVQKLIAQGATISKVFAMRTIDFTQLIGDDGKFHKEGYIKLFADVRIKLGEKELHALVDLNAKEVLRLDEP